MLPAPPPEHSPISLANLIEVLPVPTTRPSFHPVRRRPTRRGAGVVQGGKVERATVRTTLTPWGASATALPESTLDGMEAPRARPYGPAVGRGAPSIPVPADSPAEGIVLTVGRFMR